MNIPSQQHPINGAAKTAEEAITQIPVEALVNTPPLPAPTHATRGTRLVVPLRNEEPLDPFGR